MERLELVSRRDFRVCIVIAGTNILLFLEYQMRFEKNNKLLIYYIKIEINSSIIFNWLARPSTSLTYEWQHFFRTLAILRQRYFVRGSHPG